MIDKRYRKLTKRTCTKLLWSFLESRECSKIFELAKERTMKDEDFDKEQTLEGYHAFRPRTTIRLTIRGNAKINKGQEVHGLIIKREYGEIIFEDDGIRLHDLKWK